MDWGKVAKRLIGDSRLVNSYMEFVDLLNLPSHLRVDLISQSRTSLSSYQDFRNVLEVWNSCTKGPSLEALKDILRNGGFVLAAESLSNLWTPTQNFEEENMAVKAPAVGIDLGTTSSSIAVFWGGKVEVIPSDQDDGRTTTPSCIAFRGTQCFVGDPAMDEHHVVSDFSNTIFDAKRLIGRKFEDPSVQSAMKYWPFEVTRGEGGKPRLNVRVKGGHQVSSYYPEEANSIILAKLKASAEAWLGGMPVSDAVVSIPASFNQSQRQEVLDSATIAGFNVLRLIKEPVAASMGFCWENKDMLKDNDDRNVLIFELGGGSFNVAVLLIQYGIFEVKSTTSDLQLGGNDFDTRMVTHFSEQFKRRTRRDLSNSKRALCLLRSAVRSAKITLSDHLEAEINIPDLFEGMHFRSSITRQRFEELNADLFRRTLEGVEKALRDARLDKSEIHDVVLVGGSTSIPKIQQLLSEHFNGKELRRCGDPKGVVAVGAAVQAAVLNRDSNEEIQNIMLLDATPHSLGIETSGGLMTTMIRRNTCIPTKQTCGFTTGEEIVEPLIKVFEGERAMTRDNRLIGQIQLPANVPVHTSITVTLEVDSNGVLIGMAQIQGQETAIMTIHNDAGRLTTEATARMTREVEGYKQQWARNSAHSKSNLNFVIPAMFNQPDFSDVTLTCEGETFHCHKTILSANSPVFRQMFILDMQEAREAVVQIVDVDKDVLKLMIQWIYGVDVKAKLNTFVWAMDLYKVADRYLIDALKTWLRNELFERIRAENAFDVYMLGDNCQDEMLKAKAMEVMKRERREVFAERRVFDACYTRYPGLLHAILTD